jgi:hypothetical protein
MALIPTSSEAANNQQLASQFFYLVGDVMRGTDTDPRFEPGMTGGKLLGPRQSGVDIGFGEDGRAFIRGQSGTTSTPAPATPTLMGVPLTLTTLLLIAGAAYLLLLRK